MPNTSHDQRRRPFVRRVKNIFARMKCFFRQLFTGEAPTTNGVSMREQLEIESTGNPMVGATGESTQLDAVALRVPHLHITDERLHSNESASWHSIYRQLKKGRLSAHAFFASNVDRHERNYEATINDEAHTFWARSAASEAASFLMPYLPQTKAELVSIIDSLIHGINVISDAGLRRKVKFAVDRLLRDNENDATTRFKGRQLVIASWCYLSILDGGANDAELNVFFLGLNAYIDSGDYPDAPIGDVSTGLNYKIGVFQGDKEVRSDKGLDPACYGRLRNICSCMVSINHAVLSNERMVTLELPMVLKSGKVINAQMALWGSRALLFLKKIEAQSTTMPYELRQKFIDAFDAGFFEKEDRVKFAEWLLLHGMEKHASVLTILLDATSTFEDMLKHQAEYADILINETYFNCAKECMRRLGGIKQSAKEGIELSTRPSTPTH